MKFSFRVKLLLIFAGVLLALVASLGVTTVTGVQQTQQLFEVESRLIPKMEAGPLLVSEFERLARAFQDAVAAEDASALESAADLQAKLSELVGAPALGLSAGETIALHSAIDAFYDSARAVSQRMIAGESGEALLHDLARMQERQAKAQLLVRKAAVVDRKALSAAFGAVRRTNRDAERLRIAFGGLGLLTVAALAVWLGRSTFRGLRSLSTGFTRYATGDFSQDIPIADDDELGALSREANQMAASLRRLGEQRDHNDWLKAGQVGLADELRGELDLDTAASRALAYLARRIGAAAAILYLKEEGGTLRARSQYAATGVEEGSVLSSKECASARIFREGEGLIGAALAEGDLIVVDDPPTGYLRIASGLGEGEPRALVLVALTHLERQTGVMEFALLAPCSERVREFLLSVRVPLVLTLEAARFAVSQAKLLAETQAQAEQLTAQEEELRLSNQELLAQQESLRRANVELEEQREVLAEQNEALEEARTRVQQKAEELASVSSYKSQFLANMSHELRTPLNSMLLLSHLLSENEGKNLTARQVEHVKTIHSAGQDLLALINQVLDLSKIEAGKQEVDLESVPLPHFVEQVRRTFEPLVAQKGLELVTEIEAGLPTSITTDRQRVERILINLVGNAVKFTEHGHISVRIGRPPASLRSELEKPLAERAIAFSVTDTGVGIPPESLERVFMAFEQVDGSTRRRRSGSGLGLAIARESARLLGGDLLLQSAVGQGSTFVCLLPELNNGAVEARPSWEASRPPVADDRQTLRAGEGHLLVVEDDPIMAEQLVDIIRARRLKVVVVGNGREAMAMAREHQPLGIVLDVRLPDIDGWAVMELLKRDPLTQAIPVHFVSGVDAPQRALALGAVGYLVKPATHAELAGVVRVLAPLRGGSQRILVVEDDPAQGEAMMDLLRSEAFDAVLAKDASSALELLVQGDFGCLVLDLGLPDMDGLKLLEQLSQRDDTGQPRVVIHTGRALTKSEARQLETYSEAIVLKDGNSAQRLLEELRLFVRYVKERKPQGVALSAATTATEATRVARTLEGVRILLAEDDMRTVYAISALLRGKGAEVVVAETGREALAVLDSEPQIQCVLMDVMMPEMDGYTAMRALRRDARFAELPVIALTAKAMKGERERCVEAGASSYISKPIDGDQLVATVWQWVMKGPAHGT